MKSGPDAESGRAGKAEAGCGAPEFLGFQRYFAYITPIIP